MPDQEIAGLESRLFQRRVLPWNQILGYVPTRGHIRHRQGMAAWLGRNGFPVDADRIVLTGGAQHAIAAAFSAVLQPGDTLLLEELTYSGARFLAQQLRLKTAGVAIDAEGLKPEALEQACRTSPARVLYCMFNRPLAIQRFLKLMSTTAVRAAPRGFSRATPARNTWSTVWCNRWASASMMA